MIGRVLHAVTRWAGTSTVNVEAIGQTVISVDSTRDFILDSGYVLINGAVQSFTSVDRINSTITLSASLTVALPNGTDVKIFPLSRQRLVLVEPDATDSPSDALWAKLPHALSALVAEDGPRVEGNGEVVEYERVNESFMVMDVKDRVPQLNEDTVPDGFIKEVMIGDQQITAPLMAANSVAAQNIQFGAASGDKLSADAINGKTIIAPIIKSAVSGERTEMKPTGIEHIDASGTVDVKIGNTNKFTGDFEALSAIFREKVQLFGRDNLFGIGSKVTLKAGAAAPSAAPVLSWEYEAGPAVSLNGWFVTGVHTNTGGTGLSTTEIYGNSGILKKTGGAKWEFPQIPYSGGTASEFKPWSYTRIAKLDTGAERAVMLGEDYNHISGGYPQTWVRVYDDSGILSSGAVAPTKKWEGYLGDFSYLVERRLIRVIDGTNRHQFAILTSNSSLVPGDPKTVTLDRYGWDNTDNTVVWFGQINLGAILFNNESLAGGVYGNSVSLGLDIASTTVLVVQTDQRNLVFDMSGTPTFLLASSWEKGFGSQQRTWVQGNLSTNSFDGFFSHNWAAGSDVVSYKYASNHKSTTSTIWATYVWRGEAATSYRTQMAPQASIAHRSMARLKVTMPALPAPIAGVGGTRDPTKDVYGWVYFLGVGGTIPARTAMYEQANTPALASNTPLGVSNVSLSTYPVLSGTNPPASGNFPTAAPATIESDNGLLVISGDGKVTADELLGGAIDKLYDILVPIGTIVSNFTGVTPYRCLKLTDNPVAVSRTTYAALFAAIGTTGGPGNGTTTFDLPSVSGRGIIGAGIATGANGATTQTFGSKVGEQTHLLTAAESGLPSSNIVQQVNGGGYFFNVGSDGDATHRATLLSAASASSAHNNMQPSLVAHYYIRY